MLHFSKFGKSTDAPPLLIAHGLFGSARNWGVIAKRIAQERQVIAVDMRNHGESPWELTHSYFELAEDLAEIALDHGGYVDLLGHSMGGKAAMVLALKQPELLRRMIVADIAPVAYDHSQSHLIDAMKSIDLSTVQRRPDADLQLVQSVEDKTTRAFLLQSLDVASKKWRLNLDVLEQFMDDVTGWPRLSGQASLPVLFLLGAQSTYMTDQGRKEAKRLFPKARFAKIPDAGHWLHAEKPREFEATVRIFLNS